MRLNDKAAIITGAGSGLRKAAALFFAREGAKIVVAANREKEGEQNRQVDKRENSAGDLPPAYLVGDGAPTLWLFFQSNDRRRWS